MSRQVNLGQIVPNIQIGTTQTLEEGSQAQVINTGTALNPILNFYIPKGSKGDAGQIRFIVVTTLPVTDIDVNAIYLVPTQETSTGNIYAEYIYLNGQWEKLGETPIEVDLSDYYKKSQVYNKTEIDGMIGDIETALTNLNTEAEAI